MKAFIIRSALAVVFILGLPMLSFGDGPIGAAISNSLVSLAFAFGVAYWTGNAPVFVPIITFAGTVIYPLMILAWIGERGYGSWWDSLWAVINHIRSDLWVGGLFLVPTAATVTIVLVLRRWPLPIRSSH